MKNIFRFTFKLVDKTQQQLILNWIEQKHIKEWLHGDGLKNTIDDLEQFVSAGKPWAKHWIVYDNEIPFAYILTSEVKDQAKSQKKAITLDLFICNLDYIGKGFAVKMIHEFLIHKFSHIEEVHIDPEISNARAIHVYKKAGFSVVKEFIASWHPVPHYLMKLDMTDILHIEKRRLKEVDKKFIIQLLNDPLVKRHMPLSADNFDERQYKKFIDSKEAIWNNLGFGPCAYFVNNEFIGWGGIQPDTDDFEMALVLSPSYWGYGKRIYNDLIKEAFIELNLPSITILFPPSRKRIKGILRAGFIEENRTDIDGECFVRYRLNNPKNKKTE